MDRKINAGDFRVIKTRPLLFFITLSLLLLAFAFRAVCVSAESGDAREDVTLAIEKTEYDYSPDGIVPEISCMPADALKNAEIEYTGIDASVKTEACGRGEKTVLDAGKYVLTVRIPESEKTKGAIYQTTVTVMPAEVFIVTPYNKAAYSDLDNPPEYYLEPSWASEFITVSEEYYPVTDLSSSEAKKIDKPKDMGQYFVKLRPSYNSKNIKCELKQFVYEIAVTSGNKLTDAEAKSPVPSWFSASVENVIKVYSGERIKTEYTVNPALTECELKYRLLTYNDNMNEYTSELPKEPGDYQAACFASGVMIGDGSISIEKLGCSITLKDAETDYSPEGFVPVTESLMPEELKVKYVAYTVDEQGTPTNEEVPIPIVKCGRFFVVASPEDTAHYRNDTSYAYITINKVRPVFDEKTQYYEYDGKPHPVRISAVQPFMDYSVEYTEIDQNGTALRKLGVNPPLARGRYVASVMVSGSETVEETTAFIEIKITSGAEKLQSREQDGASFLLGDIDFWSVFFIAVPLVIIISVCIYLFVRSKKE